MKIGISSGNFGFHSDSMDPAALGKKAEELGFESFFMPEHTIFPVDCSSPYVGTLDGSRPDYLSHQADPLITLARVSAATQNIKLGTAVLLVPEHEPMLLAKQIATLDYLSGGRFIFGIGAGWNREESEILGGDFEHRWTQVRDSVLAMKELWTKDEAEYHGRYYDFPLVRCNPKPAQRPHPPVLLGGNARNVFRRAVAWGDGWIPGVPIGDIASGAAAEYVKRGRDTMDELASAAGRDPDSLEITMFVGIDSIIHNVKSPADEISMYDGISPDVIESFADVGVERVVFQTRTNRGEEALRVIERLAERVLR